MTDFRKGFIVGGLAVAALVAFLPGTGESLRKGGQAAKQAASRMGSPKSDSRAADSPRTVLKRATIATLASSAVGNPYKEGGKAPGGFDCSGLVHWTHSRVKKKTPRTVSELWSGPKVAWEQRRAGDLVFFQVYRDDQFVGHLMNRLTARFSWLPNHVGIYVGGGKMIHAPRSGKKVEVKKITEGFWKNHRMGLRDWVAE